MDDPTSQPTSKRRSKQHDGLSLLPYEQQVMLDTFVDDVVFITARGLGVERLFLNHLHLYSDPSFTVIVLNTTPEDEHFFLEKLRQLSPKCPPKLLTYGVSTKDRSLIYQTGGVQFVTSRIFMVDLLTNIVPLERTAGILVYRAHEVLTGYQESFILRLFREKKNNGFVKAFTDAPSAISSGGLGQLQRLTDRLYVKRVRVVPRFEESVKATLSAAAPNFIEMSVKLTPMQRIIRTRLVDIIATCVRELKQCTHGLDIDPEIETTPAAAALRPTALEIELRRNTLMITERQERLMSDLRILRKLLESVENLDPVSVHIYINDIRTNKEFIENNSGWVMTATASKIFSGIEEQCTAKDSKGQTTIVAPPKWKAFEAVLNEIKEELAKSSPANFMDQPPILVLASNESTCSQLIELSKFGSNKLCWLQSKQYAEYVNRKYDVSEPLNEPLWPVDTIALYDEQILEKDKKKLIQSVKEVQKKEGRARAQKRTSKTKIEEEIDPKQPKLVNFGIVRYAEKMADKKRPPKIDVSEFMARMNETEKEAENEPTTSTASTTVNPTSVVDDDVVIIPPDENTQESMTSDSSLVLPVLLFTTLNNRYNLLDCLESLRPRHLILYHNDLPTTRVIEGFAAHHKPHSIQLFSLTYANSTEEERYLTSMRSEQNALETLIKDQGALYVPAEYDVTRESTSSLRSLTLQTDSRRNRQPEPEVEELQPMVIIDVREFNSELPTVIYKRGIDLQPATLEVGDYVLSPSVCVERKALDDLAQSLVNGRVFKQVEQMLRHYKKTVLLIESSEKFRKKRVNGGPFQGELSRRSRETRSLFTMLLRANPRVIVFWSLSPSHSAELFEELKLDEPNPVMDAAKGIRSDDLGVDEVAGDKRVNTVVRRQLLTLPGTNIHDVERVMRSEQFKTVGDFVQSEASTLGPDIISLKSATELVELFQIDFRGARG
ncbi:ERCC4 domain-containing protein [Aphelenchoides besseyi]|nr:ERCC4 domain-containing protein [Aphelenchoides besseyi]